MNISVLNEIKFTETNYLNSGFFIIQGDFIIQEENGESIQEALSVLRGWNEQRKPKYFMTDFSEAEINAVEAGAVSMS